MAARDYLDFDLQIDDLGESGYRAQVLTAPAGRAESHFRLPFSALELENFFLRIGRPRHGVRRVNSPEMNDARKFGSRLYEAVFQTDLHACLLRSIDYAEQRNLGVRLRLLLPPSLSELPWEYLYDPAQQRFLVHSTQTPVVRYLDLPHSPKPLTVALPLKVLVMIAGPQDTYPLDVEAEWQKIKAAVRSAEQRGLVHLTRLPSDNQQRATLAALQRQLRSEQFHIFHFVGHGGFDAQSEDGVLLFESDDGRSRLVSGNYLGTLLHDHPSLRLALLNACEGARTTPADPFAGVAQQLVRHGIPAVIAMQNEITDAAAIRLAHEFYDALLAGYPVDGALAEARKALFAAGNDIEWGTPVLYLRSADGKLFDLTDAPPAPARSASVPETAHESAVAEVTTQASAEAAASASVRSRRHWRSPLLLAVAGLLLAAGGLLLWNEYGSSLLSPADGTPVVAAATATQPAAAATLETPQSQPAAPILSASESVSRTILLAEASAAVDSADSATARRIYEQLLAANPADVDALVGLARALRIEGNNPEALRALSNAYAVAPDNPAVNYALGVIYYEGFENHQLALEHLTRALDTASPGLRQNIYYERASVYSALGDYERAVADMDELITTQSNSDDYVRRAQIYQAWGDEDAAERDFSAAIDRAPSAGKYYLYRANFFARLDRIEEAVSDYGSFLKLRDPDENQGEIDRAESYIRLHASIETGSPAEPSADSVAAGAEATSSLDGATYVYVPAGVFRMGLDEGGFDEKPQHDVQLDAFWIMQTEVTNEQYEKCVVADVCPPPFHPEWGTDEFWAAHDVHPVTYVTWEQAAQYAEWVGGRLPTEAEWEKAARSSDGRRYPWGDTTPTEQRVNFDNNVGATQPVGSYPDGASPYGALDIAGNVWEWVADWYAEDYYATSPRENPTGPADGERRVLRGGAFDSDLFETSVYYRGGATMTDTSDAVGFRVVRETAPE